MKLINLFVLVLLFNGCQKKANGKKIIVKFDYSTISTNKNFKADTDKKQLIYEILNRAVVERKDIPDYNLIKNKQTLYICDFYYSDYETREKVPLDQSEIPTKIENVEFLVKSENKIQEIANETNDFLYLTLNSIEINGEKAKIGLSNYWVMSEKNKGKYAFMSGGSYILSFNKINGRWIFDPNGENLFIIS